MTTATSRPSLAISPRYAMPNGQRSCRSPREVAKLFARWADVRGERCSSSNGIGRRRRGGTPQSVASWWYGCRWRHSGRGRQGVTSARRHWRSAADRRGELQRQGRINYADRRLSGRRGAPRRGRPAGLNIGRRRRGITRRARPRVATSACIAQGGQYALQCDGANDLHPQRRGDAHCAGAFDRRDSCPARSRTRLHHDAMCSRSCRRRCRRWRFGRRCRTRRRMTPRKSPITIHFTELAPAGHQGRVVRVRGHVVRSPLGPARVERAVRRSLA